MSNELKPCAHCGDTPVIEEWRRRGNWTTWRVTCNRCGINTDWYWSLDAALDVWNKRVDKPTCKSEQADSQAKLEAEVMVSVSNLVNYCDAHPELFEKAKSWLNRQAAITKDECLEEHRKRLSELHDLLDKATRERNNLQARVDHLTYDAKKWADAASEQRLVAIEQADKVQKLTAECDELRDKLMDATIKLDAYKTFWESSK